MFRDVNMSDNENKLTIFDMSFTIYLVRHWLQNSDTSIRWHFFKYTASARIIAHINHNPPCECDLSRLCFKFKPCDLSHQVSNDNQQTDIETVDYALQMFRLWLWSLNLLLHSRNASRFGPFPVRPLSRSASYPFGPLVHISHQVRGVVGAMACWPVRPPPTARSPAQPCECEFTSALIVIH